jgi:predicted dehydrogenase
VEKLRWGVLGCARIATAKVIPAMQAGKYCAVTAIASRTIEKAEAAARTLGIAKAYGSYEALLSDPDVDAVYIPLPNHLHVPWSIRSLRAGKHVLCEKPIGLNLQEAEALLREARQHAPLKIMEAFMYRFHPQWQLARRLVEEGAIGEIRTIQSFFSYRNQDPADIRNIADLGGGGLMDIGCYSISLSRFLFQAEPRRVVGTAEVDPVFGTDRLASAILEFPRGTSTFTCSTQLSPHQRVHIHGTEGRVEIEIPFNAPPDRPATLWHQRGGETRRLTVDVADQYTVQGDLFALAVLEDREVPTPLEDAVANMRVIEAVVLSAGSGSWVEC